MHCNLSPDSLALPTQRSIHGFKTLLNNSMGRRSGGIKMEMRKKTKEEDKK
jgi:hypothetical protein